MYFEYWQSVEVKVKNGWFDYLIPFIAGGLGAWLSHLLTVKRTYEFNEALNEVNQFEQTHLLTNEKKYQDEYIDLLYTVVFVDIDKDLGEQYKY